VPGPDATPVNPAHRGRTPIVAFSNIKPLKAAQLIANQVRNAVLSGELSAGDRLPAERDLIKQLGYSRGVVREGLRLLEADGLITLQSGRNGGAIVCNPDITHVSASLDLLLRLQSTTVRDVHEAQRLIEPLIVRQAIKHANAKDLARLQATITLIEQNPEDVELVREQSNQFHILLGESTHNNVLAVLATLIRQVVIGMRYSGDRTAALSIARVHQRILDAVRDRDEVAAVRRALRHVNSVEDVMEAQTRGAGAAGAHEDRVRP
jgi:GntR family transcriptional repressor for pyruvate dehydrogenase complex